MVVYVFAGEVVALTLALALAWKWQFGLARTAVWMGVFGVVSGAAVWAIATATGLGGGATIAAACLATIALGAAAVLYRFYRDPERTPPERQDVIVSPADGEVVYVRESVGGVLPVSTKQGRRYALTELTKTPFAVDEAVVIGIALSFLDVHVNRSPVAGRVTLVRRFPGRFGSLRDPQTIFENERATLLLDRGDVTIGVVQIASRLVRRIVSFVTEGEQVELGTRIGVIRFGSQVDVVLPQRDDLDVRVAAGDRIRAGESIVAVLPRSQDAHAGTSGNGEPAQQAEDALRSV
jgi:phosphatidylserine decarboxylase